MEIVYAAHTQSGVFMLDAEGVCRWAVAHPGRTGERVPERIVGAQYLATLDLNADGALVDFPRIGCPMLFAATDPVTGRVRLVRTPPLLRFEDRRNAPTRRPLASKFETDEDRTPVAQARTSSIPPPPSSIPPPPETLPLELSRPITSSGLLVPPRTPLPPPPRARIAPRIPPAPPTKIPVRVRAGNMTLKKLARGR